MRLFTKLLISCMALCAASFVACDKAPIDENKSTELAVKLELTELNINGDGGTQSIGYTIENGINGIDIAVETDASWITNLHTLNNRIVFNCDKNFTDKARTSNIAVRYPNVSIQLIKISQEASDALTFEMEICDVKTTSCSSKLYPSDNQTPYIVYMAEKDYLLSSQISNERELFEDDFKTFTSWANSNGATNLKQYMKEQEIYYTGNSYIGWGGMVPDKEYVIYAYAIEFNDEGTDYTLASPVTHEIVILPTHIFSDIEFDVEITVDGPKATYEFEPVNWDGKYFIEIYAEGDYMYLAEGQTPDEAYCKQVANNWIGMINTYMQSGYSAAQLLELMCLQGPEEYSELLKGNTNYAMVIYAVEMVDGLPQVASTPQIKNFTTEEVGASQMTIDIKVENKYVRVADIIITPSTNDPYTVAIVAKNEVPDKSDEEIIEWCNKSFYMESYQGTITSHINSFKPETEYTILAYGYYGDVVTTELFRLDFTTDAESECENSVVRVDFNGPYSLMELEAYDSDRFYNYGMFETMGWYAMWSEIITEKPTQDLFYCIYSAQEVAVYGEAAVFADLVSYSCDSTQILTGQNGTLYVMCAVAMDYRGNYSEMWMSEPFMYNYEASTKRPLEELIDKIFGAKSSAKQLKVQSTVPAAKPLRASLR